MSASTGATGIAAMATATPSTRDRYVDLLRAMSIGVVVLGHWLMAVVYFRNGELSGENALDVIPGIWLATWILQVMPIFFFVGGFSNKVSIESNARKNGGYSTYLRGRIRRLTTPTWVFVGVWVATAAIIEWARPEVANSLATATELIAKPLWFLAVYVIVVCVAPAMLKLHNRSGARVLVGLVAAAVAVDAIRIGLDHEWVGYLNFAFVWLFAHQLGFFYADGSLTNMSRKGQALLAVGGLVALTVLTNINVYSRSMVGTESDLASNNSPASICLIALTTWLVGLTMLARPAASRWLKRPRVWLAVIGANSVIMTVFLWHLTAVLLAVVTAIPLGFPQPDGGTAEWWMTRPLWIVLLCAYLVPFVAMFGRFERKGLTRPDVGGRHQHNAAGMAIAAGLLVTGLAGFATSGFAGMLGQAATSYPAPLPSTVAFCIGAYALTRRAASGN